MQIFIGQQISKSGKFFLSSSVPSSMFNSRSGQYNRNPVGKNQHGNLRKLIFVVILPL